MKKIYLVILMILCCFLLSCANESDPPPVNTPIQSITDENPPADEATTDEQAPIEPTVPDEDEQPPTSDDQAVQPTMYPSELSGLAIDEQYAALRPIAVMINNNKASLPQSGISAADIIFECEAEGGETRMMALFKPYSALGTIGTIRSSRDYFIDFAQIFDAVYVHAGGSPQAYADLKSRKIQNLDGVNMYLPNCFWRDAERRKTSALEHTLVTSGVKIAQEIDRLGYRTQLKDGYEASLSFAEEKYVPNGESAVYLKIPRAFPSEFNYNAETELYTHTQHGRVQSDAENGEELTFTNVIVLFCGQRLLGDEKNHISVNFVGEGKGYFISMGKYIPIKWQRDSRDGGVMLLNEMGGIVDLNPGKSFISIVNSYYTKSLTFN